MTPQEKILWTENATYREKVIMLQILDLFGKKFSATQEEIANKLGVNVYNVINCMKGLKELGWIEVEKVYARGNKRGVLHNKYRLHV